MALGTIRIEGSGPTGRGHRVILESMDISHMVRSVRVYIDAQEVDRVELELTGKVELPDELKAAVYIFEAPSEDVTALGDKFSHFLPMQVEE